MQTVSGKDGVDVLLKFLWRELEPLEFLRVMTTLSFFFKTFKRSQGEQFTTYDSNFRAQCLRLTEVGCTLSGVSKAYWFLDKASISEDLRRSVVASAGGVYEYERLRTALCAIVPEVNRSAPAAGGGDRGHQQHGRWNNGQKTSHRVHAVAADEDDVDGDMDDSAPGTWAEDWDEEVEAMEAEAQILMTQAAKRRGEANRNRGFARQESTEQRGRRIDELKKKMACAACRARGKVVYGHWHGDDACPYKNDPKPPKKVEGTKLAFVVNNDNGDGSDGSEDA